MGAVERFENYLSKIIPGMKPFDFRDRNLNRKTHTLYMLNRTQRIFAWQGLPDTIPQRMLETYLQTNGNACFYQHNNSLYVFVGGLGGEPDVYYRPTIYTISNPSLKLTINAKINEDCIVMPNDSYYMGLLPLMGRYTTLLSENELTMEMAIIQARITALISADDDKTYKSAQAYIEKIKNGDFDVIADSQFFDGLKTSPYAIGSTHTLTDLIEMEQYIKASFFNDLGINANYNMKRESLNSEESQLNHDALYPLIDDMLRNRQIYAEKVNAMFGTSISVQLDSAWRDNELEKKEAQKNINEGGETLDNDETDTSD